MNRLKNGLELTITAQLLLELSDQYPVKQLIKKRLKDFLKVAENDISNEYERVYKTNREYALNAIEKRHELIKNIADFDEADFILYSEFTQKFIDNIEIARTKGTIFFNKILL